MKYLIASDLHGSLDSLKIIIDFYKNNHIEKIIFLGDLISGYYYSGDSKDDIIDIFNDKSVNVSSCRGNCDSFYDERYFPFILSESIDLKLNDYQCHFEHGHRLSFNVSKNKDYDIVFFGHTHIKEVFYNGKTLFVNPGSVALPRDGKIKSFAVFEDKCIFYYDVDTLKVIQKIDLSNLDIYK